MEAEISQGPALQQGRPKALPATQSASQKFSGGKNKEVGVRTKFKIGKLILSKKIKLLQPAGPKIACFRAQNVH